MGDSSSRAGMSDYGVPLNGMTPAQRLNAMAKAGYDITYPAKRMTSVLGEEIKAIAAQRVDLLAALQRIAKEATDVCSWIKVPGGPHVMSIGDIRDLEMAIDEAREAIAKAMPHGL